LLTLFSSNPLLFAVGRGRPCLLQTLQIGRVLGKKTAVTRWRNRPAHQYGVDAKHDVIGHETDRAFLVSPCRTVLEAAMLAARSVTVVAWDGLIAKSLVAGSGSLFCFFAKKASMNPYSGGKQQGLAGVAVPSGPSNAMNVVVGVCGVMTGSIG
jgi:hypothetical protein